MDGCTGKMIPFSILENDCSGPVKLSFYRFCEIVIKIMTFLISLTQLMANVCYAEDTLPSLMKRMKSDSAVRIEYQEIRELDLMDQPWHGSGFMYSLPPDMMIREQLKPERVLMGVKANQLYYFDSENEIRHQGEMDEENPLSLNVAMFKALMIADETLLHRLYKVDFSTSSQRWKMNLMPKQGSETGLDVIVSGLSGKSIDLIRIKQADGDVNEFLLKKSKTGEEINKTVNQLYQEILGD